MTAVAGTTAASNGAGSTTRSSGVDLGMPPRESAPASRTKQASDRRGPRRLAVRSRRRVPWILSGLFLIAGSALGFVLWMQSQAERDQVLVSAQLIEVGREVTLDDLALAEVALDPGVSSVAAAMRSTIVGQVAQVTIPQGALLHPDLVGPPTQVPNGRSVVGAALPAGSFPVASLSVGDPLTLFEVSDGLDDSEVAELGPAAVWDVMRVDVGGDPRVFLSLVVDSEIAAAVADASANDRLHVVLAALGS